MRVSCLNYSESAGLPRNASNESEPTPKRMLTQAMSRMDLTKDWALLCPEGLPHSAATYAFAYRALVFMNTSCWCEMARRPLTLAPVISRSMKASTNTRKCFMLCRRSVPWVCSCGVRTGYRAMRCSMIWCVVLCCVVGPEEGADIEHAHFTDRNLHIWTRQQCGN